MCCLYTHDMAQIYVCLAGTEAVVETIVLWRFHAIDVQVVLAPYKRCIGL